MYKIRINRVTHFVNYQWQKPLLELAWAKTLIYSYTYWKSSPMDGSRCSTYIAWNLSSSHFLSIFFCIDIILRWIFMMVVTGPLMPLCLWFIRWMLLLFLFFLFPLHFLSLPEQFQKPLHGAEQARGTLQAGMRRGPTRGHVFWHSHVECRVHPWGGSGCQSPCAVSRAST